MSSLSNLATNGNEFRLFSLLMKTGTAGKCFWGGTMGIELNILSSVYKCIIVTVTVHEQDGIFFRVNSNESNMSSNNFIELVLRHSASNQEFYLARFFSDNRVPLYIQTVICPCGLEKTYENLMSTKIAILNHANGNHYQSVVSGSNSFYRHLRLLLLDYFSSVRGEMDSV